MKHFNMYYGYHKINSMPLKEDDVNNIMNQKYIYKMIDNKSVKIKTSDVKIIKCIIL